MPAAGHHSLQRRPHHSTRSVLARLRSMPAWLFAISCPAGRLARFFAIAWPAGQLI